MALTRTIIEIFKPLLSKFTFVLIVVVVMTGLLVFQSRIDLTQMYPSRFTVIMQQRFNHSIKDDPKLTTTKGNNSHETGNSEKSKTTISPRRASTITIVKGGLTKVVIANSTINKLTSKITMTTTTTKVTPIVTPNVTIIVTSSTKPIVPTTMAKTMTSSITTTYKVTPNLTSNVKPTNGTIVTSTVPNVASSVRTSTPAKVKKKTYVCKQIGARLGNQMYMFATSYGTARRNNMTLVMKNDATLRATFNIEGAYNTNWTLCKDATTISEPSCCRAWPNIYNVSNEKTVILGGYLQSYKYFDDHRDEVRKYLTFRNNVLNEANNKLTDLFKKRYPGQNKEKRTLIGVHIRRGDYLSSNSIKFGYVTAPKEYIFRAQKYMETKYSNITYFVCSNDLAWTNDVFKGQTDAIIVPIGPAHVDLALLSLMDHMIMTVGTYGFWASWFVNGTTIYLKDFTKPGSNFGNQFDKDHLDTIPPSWIGL
ncbi:galactoside alpha-(1,2)-fucosyltransferase 2 isoform X2 [Patella vulgata]|uniref:galactoside alpha-(1,2)-fucosyltransferase 2 isoform X2 n=1 Tax=Patella vulgata TaxID=6465 RepID=UPI0024A7B1AF|nr:galactoside alpha-(1,2)-fucosyltransferase 2 isoform X2 [Patella vulgata]